MFWKNLILADKIKLNNVFYEFSWNYEFGMVSKDRKFFLVSRFEFSILPISVRFLFPVK